MRTLIGVDDPITVRERRRYLLRDTFSRADSALTLGTPDLGPSPTVLSGTWGISSGRAYNASDLDGNLVVWDLATPNGTFEATVRGTLASGTDFRLADLVVRVLDTSNYIRIVCGAGAFNVQKADGGAVSNLVATGLAWADDTDYRIKVVMSGNLIRVWRDGANLLSYTLAGGDTKYAAYTRHGFRLRKSGTPATAARWDNAAFWVGS